MIHQGSLHSGSNTAAANLLAFWALASMFLPGPYAGVLVAARWVND
jgi:hypothetical protein